MQISDEKKSIGKGDLSPAISHPERIKG